MVSGIKSAGYDDTICNRMSELVLDAFILLTSCFCPLFSARYLRVPYRRFTRRMRPLPHPVSVRVDGRELEPTANTPSSSDGPLIIPDFRNAMRNTVMSLGEYAHARKATCCSCSQWD